MKNCSVQLSPCTPILKKCYVSLEKCKIPSTNVVVDESNITSPKLTTITEPCTPNVEPELATELRRAITEKNILTTKTKSKFILALNDLEKSNAEIKRQERKAKAMKEVIDSEVAYLKQLDKIIKHFKEPLANKCVLPAHEIEKIFGKIAVLYNINKELLDIMNEFPTDIAQAFKKVAPYFKMYSTYAYEYNMISCFLQELLVKNGEFTKFLKCQETRPEVQTKLTSLLIAPIQRIPRYCLLIKQVLLYTLMTEDDYLTLKESLRIVEESAKHINSLVQDREYSEKLLNIQNSLVNNNPLIVKPGRKLIKEGKILKMTDTVGRVMYLVAMTDILMFCKIKKDNINSKNALKCSVILPLNKCKFTQNAKLRKILISCENNDIEIFVETAKEFDRWINVLNETHKNFISNRCTLRKESSTRRPAYKEALSNYNEDDISPSKLQRKRKIEAINIPKDTNTTMNKPTRPSYPLLTKRRCIREGRPETSRCSTNDSLYPLRHHYFVQIDLRKNINEDDVMKEQNNEVSSQVNDGDSKKDDVFVFGNSDNKDTGFNFRIMNFFTHIGNSLKRMFRIK